jgi:hypothetical protein
MIILIEFIVAFGIDAASEMDRSTDDVSGDRLVKRDLSPSVAIFKSAVAKAAIAILSVRTVCKRLLECSI